MEDLYDVIVVGGGPAGLTSAIYLARAKYRVLVLEKEKFGGQITITEEIVNYPGVERASGASLTEGMRRQAEHFGAAFKLAHVEDVEPDEEFWQVRTDGETLYRTLGVVLAVGASPRKIGFTGEKEFQGRGVAYCATCDGEFFTDREVLVVGGGFAAVEEAVFLTKYASKITMIVRGADFTCAAGVADKLKSYPQIRIHFHTEVKGVFGERFLNRAVLWNNETGEEWEYTAEDGENFGVFVFAGYEPATNWLAGRVALNEQGYILTDREQSTDRAGIYAAGDVCVKGLRQVVTAVGDGAVAATSLEHYVSKLREKLGMPKADWQPSGKADADPGTAASTEAAAANGFRQEGGFRSAGSSSEGGLIDDSMRQNLKGIFDKFERQVTVAAVTDGSGASKELEAFAGELQGISEHVAVAAERKPKEKKTQEMGAEAETDAPYLEIRLGELGTGIRFYSVPGGHEFNSFVLALYQTAGPGREMDEGLRRRVEAFKHPHTVQIMTTLSCTNCPDVVAGVQQIASISGKISAWMYDLAKFPEYKERYGIMAVPCMVVDGEQTYFGKKSMEELVEILEQA
ncbi:MAG: FAD-dependent oxidoreductase [Muribaculum sp.]|nr:FAD-dependent oxidoreductase [Muribaculum sp.]